MLSDYFKEVYTVEDTTNLPTVSNSDSTWNDTELEFSESIFLEKLQKLKMDKSPGLNGIHPSSAEEVCTCFSRATVTD